MLLAQADDACRWKMSTSSHMIGLPHGRVPRVLSNVRHRPAKKVVLARLLRPFFRRCMASRLWLIKSRSQDRKDLPPSRNMVSQRRILMNQPRHSLGETACRDSCLVVRGAVIKATALVLLWCKDCPSLTTSKYTRNNLGPVAQDKSVCEY
jgi:hypothetical protein